MLTRARGCRRTGWRGTDWLPAVHGQRIVRAALDTLGVDNRGKVGRCPGRDRSADVPYRLALPGPA